jgi:hypothetical protein
MVQLVPIDHEAVGLVAEAGNEACSGYALLGVGAA